MERYAYRDVDERVIVVIPGLVQERETEVALERVARRLQHRDAVETRDLRLLVELRGPRCILHRLPREDRADLLLELRDLVSVRRNRLDGPQIQLARQGKAGVRSEPRLERKASLGSEIGPPAVLAHHRVQRRRDVRDVGDHRSLRRIDGMLRREDGVHAELRHEPAFLGGGVVVAAGQRAGVPDGARELRFPASHDAGDHGFREMRIELVMPTRLTVEDRRLAAGVVGEREGEFRRGEMDVDVLSAGDHRARAPARGEQVAGDRRREPARVRKDGDGSLAQDLAGLVAAQRSSDADLVPGVGHSQAVGAEDVDAPLLSQRANLARVAYGHLLGDDEDLAELGVDADQLGDAVARRGRRQVHHAAIEAVPRGEPFAHGVVDGNVAGGRRERLPLPSGRGPEDHVSAGPGMTYRCHLARLAAEDVEDAHPIVAGCHLRERADADEILEISDSVSHAIPRRVASWARPPAFMKASTRFAYSITSLMSESDPNIR